VTWKSYEDARIKPDPAPHWWEEYRWLRIQGIPRIRAACIVTRRRLYLRGAQKARQHRATGLQ
jgi:hypothetical protein